MITVRYLRLDDALDLIRVLGVGPVRDLGLLASGLARPQSGAFGSDAYRTTDLKAAALLDSLTNNHSLVDGNKRLAWLATTVFLAINDHGTSVSNDEAFDLVVDVAAGSVELQQIAARLRVGSPPDAERS